MWLQCCSVQTRESHTYRSPPKFHHCVDWQVTSLERRLQRGSPRVWSPRVLSEIGAAGTVMLSPLVFLHECQLWPSTSRELPRSILSAVPPAPASFAYNAKRLANRKCPSIHRMHNSQSTEVQLCWAAVGAKYCSSSGHSMGQFSLAARHNQYVLRGKGGGGCTMH